MKHVTFKMMSGLCLTSVLLLNGCADKPEEKKLSIEQKETKTKTEATEIGQEKVVQDKKMKITEVKAVKDDMVSAEEQIVQVAFDIKNEG
ncbi:hypothetical protein P4530_30435, partial [Bacillus thuringiensis]|nr:hypothetical protein [Bacillus thuringiensis]